MKRALQRVRKFLDNFWRSTSPAFRPKTEQSVLKTNLGGGGVLLRKRLLGMFRWMGSHFNNWFGYNGVTFLEELLERGRTFSGFLG